MKAKYWSRRWLTPPFTPSIPNILQGSFRGLDTTSPCPLNGHDSLTTAIVAPSSASRRSCDPRRIQGKSSFASHKAELLPFSVCNFSTSLIMAHLDKALTKTVSTESTICQILRHFANTLRYCEYNMLSILKKTVNNSFACLILLSRHQHRTVILHLWDSGLIIRPRQYIAIAYLGTSSTCSNRLCWAAVREP